MTYPQPFQPLLLPTPSLSLELVPLSIAIELKTRPGHASFQYISIHFNTLTRGPEIFIFM